MHLYYFGFLDLKKKSKIYIKQDAIMLNYRVIFVISIYLKYYFLLVSFSKTHDTEKFLTGVKMSYLNSIKPGL